MPFKMIDILDAPFKRDDTSYDELYRQTKEKALQIAKNHGVEIYYFGIPRQIGQIVDTNEELRYEKKWYLLERFQRWWSKKVPPRYMEWGVYIEVENSNP